jgi:hypothetical protein
VVRGRFAVRADTLTWAIFGLVVAYNAAVLLFMMYLRRHHYELWRSFARQGVFQTAGPIDSYRFVRTGIYAVFQSDHWKLADRTATAFVFAIRIMLVAILVALPFVASTQATN